jgi:hypothetical protein
MKVFEEVTFLLKYHQNSPSPQATEHKKKKREKLLKKEERKKEEGKEKLQESLQIKGKSIF